MYNFSVCLLFGFIVLQLKVIAAISYDEHLQHIRKQLTDILNNIGIENDIHQISDELSQIENHFSNSEFYDLIKLHETLMKDNLYSSNLILPESIYGNAKSGIFTSFIPYIGRFIDSYYVVEQFVISDELILIESYLSKASIEENRYILYQLTAVLKDLLESFNLGLMNSEGIFVNIKTKEIKLLFSAKVISLVPNSEIDSYYLTKGNFILKDFIRWAVNYFDFYDRETDILETDESEQLMYSILEYEDSPFELIPTYNLLKDILYLQRKMSIYAFNVICYDIAYSFVKAIDIKDKKIDISKIFSPIQKDDLERLLQSNINHIARTNVLSAKTGNHLNYINDRFSELIWDGKLPNELDFIDGMVQFNTIINETNCDFLNSIYNDVNYYYATTYILPISIYGKTASEMHIKSSGINTKNSFALVQQFFLPDHITTLDKYLAKQNFLEQLQVITQLTYILHLQFVEKTIYTNLIDRVYVNEKTNKLHVLLFADSLTPKHAFFKYHVNKDLQNHVKYISILVLKYLLRYNFIHEDDVFLLDSIKLKSNYKSLDIQNLKLLVENVIYGLKHSTQIAYGDLRLDILNNLLSIIKNKYALVNLFIY